MNNARRLTRWQDHIAAQHQKTLDDAAEREAQYEAVLKDDRELLAAIRAADDEETIEQTVHRWIGE